MLIVFTSCQVYKEDSLDEYVEMIDKHRFGNSSCEIDTPEYLLPSKTFITDYEYIDGEYHWYFDDRLRWTSDPEVCILYLRYSRMCTKMPSPQ